MSSLHRDPKSKHWLLAYRLPDGRRTLRSTHESNRKRAKIVADAMVRLSEEEARPDTTRAFLQRIVDDTLRRLGLDGSTPSNGQAGGGDITINYSPTYNHSGTTLDEHMLAHIHRRHIDQMKRDLAQVLYENNRAAFDGAKAV